MAGRMINGAAALAELIRPAGETGDLGAHRVLPVLPELSGLLPSHGLRRGTTIAVGVTPGPSVHHGALPASVPESPVRGGEARSFLRDATGVRGMAQTGSGSTSLLLALLSAASTAGSWCAVVGVPTLGALAAAESGIALDRLALVPNPGPEWPTVVAALIDGVDVVVIAVPGTVSASITSRLVARARQRGCVLVPYGRWDGADVTLQVTQGLWEGLGAGHGRLRRRKVTVVARGRGTAARPKEITMWMPGLSAASPHHPTPGTGPRSGTDSPSNPNAGAGPQRFPAGRKSVGSGPVMVAAGGPGPGRPSDVESVPGRLGSGPGSEPVPGEAAGRKLAAVPAWVEPTLLGEDGAAGWWPAGAGCA